MSMSTGPLKPNPGVNNAYGIGQKPTVKEDIKKAVVEQGVKPAIDQNDKLQSNPVKSYDLKNPSKFPDKPSMGIEGKPPKDAQISDGQKPQMGIEGKPPKGAQISDGQKPQMGIEGKPPKGAQISDGQKPQMGIEGKPPKGAPIYPGKKVID